MNMKRDFGNGEVSEKMRGSAYVTSKPKRLKGNGVSSTKLTGGDLRTRGTKKGTKH